MCLKPRQLLPRQAAALDVFAETYPEARVIGWHDGGPVLRRGEDVRYLNRRGEIRPVPPEALR